MTRHISNANSKQDAHIRSESIWQASGILLSEMRSMVRKNVRLKASRDRPYMPVHLEYLEVNAPLPEYFIELLDRLRNIHS